MKSVSSYQSSNALLKNITGLGVSPRQAVGNPFIGGQLGVGVQTTTIDSASPLVFNPAILVVLQTPTMWDTTPEAQVMLKSIMETHAKSVTGTEFGYTLETDEMAAGHDGQTIKVPKRTTRSAVNPSAVFNEMQGNVIWNLFRKWMFDIQNPDTNASSIPAQASTSEIQPWVLSTYSMTFIMIQPDPTGLPDRIVDAALYYNVFPTEIGQLDIKRVIGTSEIQERTINFTGVVQHNENVRELAFQVYSLLKMHQVDYTFAAPGLLGTTNASSTDSVTAIQNSISNYGLKAQVQGVSDSSASATDGMLNTFYPTKDGVKNTSIYTDGTSGSGDQLITATAPASSTDESYTGTSTTATA